MIGTTAGPCGGTHSGRRNPKASLQRLAPQMGVQGHNRGLFVDGEGKFLSIDSAPTGPVTVTKCLQTFEEGPR